MVLNLIQVTGCHPCFYRNEIMSSFVAAHCFVPAVAAGEHLSRGCTWFGRCQVGAVQCSREP
jgi:hypothetical protein